MLDPHARYEVREGKLWVDQVPLPLRKGLITAALARAGWKGGEGPVEAALVERLLAGDRRMRYFFSGSAGLKSSDAELMQ